MKIGRIPLVHLARLRGGAQKHGCDGLLALINTLSQNFLNRKKVDQSSTVMMDTQIKDSPELLGAWLVLLERIEWRFGKQEKTYEAKADAEMHSEDDCATLGRLMVYIALVVPTLPAKYRKPLDRMLGERAQTPWV